MARLVASVACGLAAARGWLEDSGHVRRIGIADMGYFSGLNSGTTFVYSNQQPFKKDVRRNEFLAHGSSRYNLEPAVAGLCITWTWSLWLALNLILLKRSYDTKPRGMVNLISKGSQRLESAMNSFPDRLQQLKVLDLAGYESSDQGLEGTKLGSLSKPRTRNRFMAICQESNLVGESKEFLKTELDPNSKVGTEMISIEDKRFSQRPGG
ncbi:hypothetical protein VNO77_34238 [Canavalia gladiata]|uniref:Uncharacterized protein n=1 Tax=Canavalia gladiata TaxID=3824 RepID=A0AAN9KFU9_CANGL